MNNFRILLTRNYTKLEKDLISKAINLYLHNTINPITLHITKDLSDVNLEKLLLKLLNNKIIVYSSDSKTFINPFSSLKFTNNDIIFTLSSWVNEKRLFPYIIDFLLLKNSNSYLLYNIIINNDANFNISVSELKDLLNIHDCYYRFYDFEKYILLPLANDIMENTHYSINYEKIKNSESKNSKIISLNFSISCNNIVNMDEQPNYILTGNYSNTYMLQSSIYNFLNENNITEVLNLDFFSPILFQKLKKITILKPTIIEIKNSKIKITKFKNNDHKVEIFI